MEREAAKTYVQWGYELLLDQGMNSYWAMIINTLVVTVLVALIATVLDIVTRKIIVQTFKAFSNKTKTSFDDFLVKSNFPRFIAHFIP